MRNCRRHPSWLSCNRPACRGSGARESAQPMRRKMRLQRRPLHVPRTLPASALSTICSVSVAPPGTAIGAVQASALPEAGRFHVVPRRKPIEVGTRVTIAPVTGRLSVPLTAPLTTP
jgi:hypothetical protein